MIDPEETPPPVDPVQAVAELWGLRKTDDRIAKVENKLDLLTRDVTRLVAAMEEFVRPAVKTQQGQVGLLLEHHNRNLGRQEQFWEESWPRVTKAIDSLVTRIERLERARDTADQEVRALAERAQGATATLSSSLHALETIVAEHSARLTKLETAKAVETALTKSEKRKVAGIVAGLAAIATAITHLFR